MAKVKILPPGHVPLNEVLQQAGIGRSRWEYLVRCGYAPPVFKFKKSDASGRPRIYVKDGDLAHWLATRNRKPGARPSSKPPQKWEGR